MSSAYLDDIFANKYALLINAGSVLREKGYEIDTAKITDEFIIQDEVSH